MRSENPYPPVMRFLGQPRHQSLPQPAPLPCTFDQEGKFGLFQDGGAIKARQPTISLPTSATSAW
jgi:hypothetical protein